MTNKSHTLKIIQPIYLSLLLVCLLLIGLGFSNIVSNLNIGGNLGIWKYDKTLYGVLEKAAKKGIYAKEYIGEHQDSIDASKSTEKIYYWYGSNANNGTAILEKNNVIFADRCWQMIRTTDTGGVRLLYNGLPTITISDNNVSYNCGASRPGGFTFISSTKDLTGSFYYSSSYTTSVSGASTRYTLVDAVKLQVNNNNSRYVIDNIAEKYPYTCASTGSSCNTLYKIDSFTGSGSVANVHSTTYRDMIGLASYNYYGNSVADVGYMYNSRYITDEKTISSASTIASSVTMNSSTLSKYEKYYFADSYSVSGDKAILTNPSKGSNIEDYPSSWVGKYYCTGSTLSSESSCESLFYVGSIDMSGSNPVIYTVSISLGKVYNPDYRYLISDSIIDNGNGTFEMSGNPEEILAGDWHTVYSSQPHRYICMPNYYTYDSINNKYICSDRGEQLVAALRYIYSTSVNSVTTFKIYRYGFGFTSEGTDFRLVGNNNEEGTLQYIYNWLNSSSTNCFLNSGDSISQCGYNSLSKSHYTCFNLSGICSSYYYLNTTTSTSAFATHISNGKYVSTDITDSNNILYDMLYKSDVNINDSFIKTIVESWYSDVLLQNYDDYIDDTIYCNDRTIKKVDETRMFGGFNPNGGSTVNSPDLKFGADNLSCSNITDKFSVSNPIAPLLYKVGLIGSDINLLHNNSTVASIRYLIGNPVSFAYSYPSVGGRSESGSKTNEHTDYSRNIRPAISLVAGIEYSDGDGSTTNPYIANVSPKEIVLNTYELSFRGIGGTSTIVASTDLEGSITWESSNPSVAIVNNGMVTALSYGEAKIVARLGHTTATVSVSVLTPFEYDSWETIAYNVRNNSYSDYHVGDTKKVFLKDNLIKYTIRVANTSTPSECETPDFSQTACGFVLEFADIIKRSRMNNSNTNVGGWPASIVRTLLNDINSESSIINSLPDDLRSVIVDTIVVSGYGNTGETNFTSIDKLYLLSSHELWEDVDGNTNSGLDYTDTAYYNTRQLDYYYNLGVTGLNFSDAIKSNLGTLDPPSWWLRSTYGSDTFTEVDRDGSQGSNGAYYYSGISPAFRIG